MVQVRCPECGYLQTLSEERFLTISEDFLNCPHCHARVPKEWGPAQGEAVPEEIRHKMLAFSRRILNSGEVVREVVYALEGLVRHHGPSEESNKALGVGYAALGETKKAEEFLSEARKETPGDAEVLHTLLSVFVASRKFEDAVEVGLALIELLGERVEDDDVARLATVLLRLERTDDAQALMDSYPNLNARNPLVKQARREMNRRRGKTLGSLFRENNPFQRWFGRGRKAEERSLTRRLESEPRPRRRAAAPESGEGVGTTDKRATDKETRSSEAMAVFPSIMEYWIYAPDTAVPDWEDVRNNLAQHYARKSERERTFTFLDSVIASNALTIDYILREEATELFDYPEELIPHNSRELSRDDLETLMKAKMIVRARLSQTTLTGRESIVFMVRFVEALRSLNNGVVQDAVSHTLWGTEQWKRCVENPRKNIMERQLQWEILDEGGRVWIHTHGMLKFGLPDLEMEGFPAEAAGTGRKLMIMAAERLVQQRGRGLSLASPIVLPGTPFAFAAEVRPRDEEGHFPAGSLGILPHVAGHDPKGAEAISEILEVLRSPESLRPAAVHQAATHAEELPEEVPVENGDLETGIVEFTEQEPLEEEPAAVMLPPDLETAALRAKLIDAHERALKELKAFRKSFQKSKGADDNIHAVKVGFPARDGSYEWMWITLDAWRGKSIVGFLENVPELRKDLEKGMRVQITEGEIFDWVISREGEVLNGAYTENVLAG
jgi:uncharacterized protein YegJ (DUF2314 family)